MRRQTRHDLGHIGGVLRVVSQPATDPGCDVEPVEKGPRQGELMKRVKARAGVRVKTVCRVEKIVGRTSSGIGIRRIGPVYANRALAVIINRRVQNLLAKTGELHVRQPLNLRIKAVYAWRRQPIETPVIPIFICLNEGGRLGVFGVLAREKIM